VKLKIQARHLMRLVQESSPTILTAVGVVGVVGTAVLVGKATFRTSANIQDLRDELTEENDDREITTKEIVTRNWKFYLPAVGVGSLTIAAIIASNRIHARRLAALAAGYAILSKDFDEYRDKAFDKLGIKKADELNKEIAAEKIKHSPPMPGGVLPQGKTWFCDMSSMRYFPSTMESIKEAQNELNFSINNNGSVSLNDFYSQLGLDSTTIGDILGWNSTEKVDITFQPLLVEEYGAVTAFRFAADPFPKY
jgi:hypothetical protein